MNPPSALPPVDQADPSAASPPSTATGAARPRPVGVRRISGLSAALRFLLPFGKRDDNADAESYTHAAPWIVPIGVLIGLAWAGTFKATWRYRDEITAIRAMPALAVVLLECLLTGSFLALGLARTIHLLTSAKPLRPEVKRTAPLSPIGTLTLCLPTLSQWVLIASLPVASSWWPSYDDWRYHFRHLYPAALYRPLVLAPIWGRWAILLAATIGRTAKYADRQTVELCGEMRPGRLMRHTLFPFAITSIFLSRGGNYLTGIIVGLLVFGFTYVVIMVMARRGGGQTRQSLYAVGEIGQLAFLAMYRAFWPLIHG